MNHAHPVTALLCGLALCGCTQVFLEDTDLIDPPDAALAPDLAPGPAGLPEDHPLADDHLAAQVVAAYFETVTETLAEEVGDDALLASLQPALRCVADPQTGGARIARTARGESSLSWPNPDPDGAPLAYSVLVALDETQTFLPGPLRPPLGCNPDGTVRVGWWQADQVEGLTLSASGSVRSEHTLRGAASVLFQRAHSASGVHAVTWARPAISTEAGVATLARTLTLGLDHTLEASGRGGQAVVLTSRLFTEDGASLLETDVRTPGRHFISKTVEQGAILGQLADGARVSLRFEGVRFVGSGGRRCLPVGGELRGQISAPSGALHKTFLVRFPMDAAGSATITFADGPPLDLLLHPSGCSL